MNGEKEGSERTAQANPKEKRNCEESEANRLTSTNNITPPINDMGINNKAKPVGNKGKYGDKVWKEIQGEWESGKFTAPQISEKHSIPVSTVKSHIRLKGWEKGKLFKKIEGTIAERNKERFIQAGMGVQTAIQLVTDGMQKPEMVKFEGKGDNMLATTIPDFKTRLAYLQEYNKMTGRYAPMEKEGDKHVHFHLSESQLKDMSATDAISAYQQLQDSDD